MFTGIIEEVGVVQRLDIHDAGARLRIGCRTVLEDAAMGSSIAVNGVCLTVAAIEADFFAADLAPETLDRGNLGALRPGSPVNLERPLALSARLSGHIVQGHVDGAGELIALDPLGDGNWWLRVRLPERLERYAIEKGSITLDGISLTIARLAPGEVAAAIIPHTFEHTALKYARPGQAINVEVDLIAKYVERLLGK